MLYPDLCLYCGEAVDSGVRICSDCARSLPVISGEICNICGRQLTDCFCKIGDYAFVSNVAPYRYEGPAKAIVKRMKFRKLSQLISAMSAEIASVIKMRYPDIEFDCVTYVPMTYLKQLDRGFNQAQLLAEYISKELGIPVKPLLKKKWGTKTQKRQNRRSRFMNVRGRYYTVRNITDKTVLLIDDVMTTGATLSECALMLRKAGVGQTFCATYAITCKK